MALNSRRLQFSVTTMRTSSNINFSNTFHATSTFRSPKFSVSFRIYFNFICEYSDQTTDRVNSCQDQKCFFPSQRPDLFRGPSSLLTNEYKGTLLPRLRQLWGEAGHSPSYSTEVTDVWKPLLSFPLHGVVLN